ncbi:response regulator [Bradymonadaceae bacterium TMQ3]|uniref:Response regulator n=1 Tax=Lujinxingia sediminis TaxID=2480984 RepID=A0ABY0CX52_9DELT|nr:DUF4388 domain-containing protein [Lujinxingia sediminis]RDV39687.1 response regulator [Bradymonadaceae bacterium TMQ3]RVU48268.1 response regulator [Lujinxingia sediminis]TXC77568.1 response regulator [Bradymonadales bacterium TMQ1]
MAKMYHILIVDEEEHLLWALERNLFPQRQDIAVHTARSGEEGLRILDDQPIDLLISDIKMPGAVDGFQLILRAKEMAPDARVMIITAFGTHRIQNFAERIGISHYIEKPFTVDEVRDAILEILNEKEGFQGVLSDLELTDIIQMLCLAKRTALLHLKHRDHRGRIVFDAGEVTHAEFDGEVGPEAVYQMLALRQGDIFMQSDFESVPATIDMGWQDLLLEGVRRTDEQRFEEEQQAGPSIGGEVAGEVEPVLALDLDDDDFAPGRSLTPMGVGAATMFASTFETEPSQPGLADSSSSAALLFSQAELDEMAAASGGAVEEAAPLAQPQTQPAAVLSAPGIEELSEVEMGPAVSQSDFPGRKRRKTSPGMSAVSAQVVVTEESGEFELFAAPALNGRHAEAIASDRTSATEERAANRPDSLLEEFVHECPGLRATGLVNAQQGQALEFLTLRGDTALDESELSVRLAEVFRRAHRSVRALYPDDALEEMQMAMAGDYVLIRALKGTPYVHLAIVEREASLGIALVLMRQLGRRLTRSNVLPDA